MKKEEEEKNNILMKRIKFEEKVQNHRVEANIDLRTSLQDVFKSNHQSLKNFELYKQLPERIREVAGTINSRKQRAEYIEELEEKKNADEKIRINCLKELKELNKNKFKRDLTPTQVVER